MPVNKFIILKDRAYLDEKTVPTGFVLVQPGTGTVFSSNLFTGI